MSDLPMRIESALSKRSRLCLAPEHRVPAAVLIPLFHDAGEWQVLFTLRTRHVRHHKGQVSFPGGARHPGDADLRETALRETLEETGLCPESVRVLGALDDLPTISNYLVTPFVGVLASPLRLVPSPGETDEIFWVPLARLLDPALWRAEERHLDGRVYYPVWYFSGAPHVIWGVTGDITTHFLQVAFGWAHPALAPPQ